VVSDPAAIERQLQNLTPRDDSPGIPQIDVTQPPKIQ